MPEWISFAKVRGSWAQVGNDTDPYYVNQAYGFGTIELPNGGNIYTNTLNTIMKASNLKPERKMLGKLVWTSVHLKPSEFGCNLL